MLFSHVTSQIMVTIFKSLLSYASLQVKFYTLLAEIANILYNTDFT